MNLEITYIVGPDIIRIIDKLKFILNIIITENIIENKPIIDLLKKPKSPVYIFSISIEKLFNILPIFFS